VVFAAGRAVEGPVQLRFNSWDLDEWGGRSNIPYHVKLTIEGILQHAWTQEVVDMVLCDEALVHHVEENSRRHLDQRAFHCWAFNKDSSRIPQVVFLTLTQFEPEQQSTQLHFVRPRGIQKAHVAKVFIHIDAIEDLMFYHFLREELVADGKVPWRDFS
jgi:hypothetical protein